MLNSLLRMSHIHTLYIHIKYEASFYAPDGTDKIVCGQACFWLWCLPWYMIMLSGSVLLCLFSRRHTMPWACTSQ